MCRSTFRTPVPLLEPEDGVIHFWLPQQDSHHQSGTHCPSTQHARTITEPLIKKKILFVAQARAAKIVREQAERVNAYVNHRWLGGMP